MSFPVLKMSSVGIAAAVPTEASEAGERAHEEERDSLHERFLSRGCGRERCDVTTCSSG